MSPKMKNALENAGIANAAQVADSNRPISAQKEICQKLCIWRGRKNRCIWREKWCKILLTLHCYEYTFRICSMSKRYFKLRPEHLHNPSYFLKGWYLPFQDSFKYENTVGGVNGSNYLCGHVSTLSISPPRNKNNPEMIHTVPLMTISSFFWA